MDGEKGKEGKMDDAWRVGGGKLDMKGGCMDSRWIVDRRRRKWSW